MKHRAMLQHVMRAVCMLIACYAASVVLSAMIDRMVALHDEAVLPLWQTVKATVVAFVFCYTVCSCISCDVLYIERVQEGRLSMREHMRALLISPMFLVDVTLLLLMLCVYVTRSPLHVLLDLWTVREQISLPAVYGRMVLLSVPLYNCLFVLGAMWARRAMRGTAAAEALRRPNERKRRPSLFRYIFACLKPTVVTALICLIIPLVLSFVFTIGKLFLSEVAAFVAVAVLFVLILCFRYVRAIGKRLSFKRKLLTCAASIDAEVIFHKSVCRSLFHYTADADFTVYHKGEVYDVKLLHSMRAYTPMQFDGTGRVFLPRIYKINRWELFRTVRMLDYTFSSEGHRLLLILPTPKRLMWIGGGARHTLDVGDAVGEYTIYNGTGFIRSLERDCLLENRKKMCDM